MEAGFQESICYFIRPIVLHLLFLASTKLWLV